MLPILIGVYAVRIPVTGSLRHLQPGSVDSVTALEAEAESTFLLANTKRRPSIYLSERDAHCAKTVQDRRMVYIEVE